MDLGELVEHWTLVASEIDLAAAKHRDTRLGRGFNRCGQRSNGREPAPVGKGPFDDSSGTAAPLPDGDC
jgi:hypothetical protein